MARYKTHFRRYNFNFNPPLEQSADVVFSTKIPFEDGHLEKFEAAAWKAAFEQNPHWKDPKCPVKGAGWSSVLGSGRYTEV